MTTEDNDRSARERLDALRREKQEAEARREDAASAGRAVRPVRDLDERIDNLKSEIERLELAIEMERQSDA